MSYYPIKLDKVRNFRYGMKAIDLIEKTYGKPIMEIDGISDGKITMEDGNAEKDVKPRRRVVDIEIDTEKNEEVNIEEDNKE